jgi:hypothetical protein
MVSDPNSIKNLVEETYKVVKPNLKQLWIGAQRIVADKKREGMYRATCDISHNQRELVANF